MDGIEEGEKKTWETNEKKRRVSSVFSFFTQQLENWCSVIELQKACIASGL